MLTNNSSPLSGHVIESFTDFKLENDGSNGRQSSIRANRDASRKREVYRLETDWLISNVSWSNDDCHTLALASYLEQYENFVQIVTLERDDCERGIGSVCSFDHPYPATRVLWSPRRPSDPMQLLATSADYLRLWRVNDSDTRPSSSPANSANSNKSVKLECLLNANQAPLTSFDWSDDAVLIATSSFDSSCTIWDVNSTQIVNSINSESSNYRKLEHVYDIAWSHRTTGREEIVLCGDKSVRLLDLRRPSDSIVLFEIDNDERSVDANALVRVSCSKQDENLVASLADNSCSLFIFDLRQPGRSLCVLNHSDAVNSVSWSPKSSKGICSGGEDQQALIWQVADASSQRNEPLLAYRASGKINSVSWSPSNTFIAIGFRNTLELLRV